MLTQERLKELLDYDPDTGLFTWKESRGGTTKGDVAGCRAPKRTKHYILIGIDGVLHRAHRLVFLYINGSNPDDEVDHINGDGTDNRLINLRPVDRQTNLKNMRLHSHNTSGVSGVSWRSNRNKWRSYITLDNKQVTLGHYADFFEAVCVRKSAERRYGFHENHGSNRPL